MKKKKSFKHTSFLMGSSFCLGGGGAFLTGESGFCSFGLDCEGAVVCFVCSVESVLEVESASVFFLLAFLLFSDFELFGGVAAFKTGGVGDFCEVSGLAAGSA